MRSTTLVGVGALLVLQAAPASAQADDVHGRIAQVAVAFEGTPTGQGLLTTAAHEAAIAAQHVEFANAVGASFADVQLHVSHALHALDPSLAPSGPGLGYGVRHAVDAAATHLGMAASDSLASENVKVHAEHVAVILANVTARVDQAVALAAEVMAASSAAPVASLLARLSEHCETVVAGRDIDGDGRIGWRASEGGLRQAAQHMTLLQRGEGLIP
ncbi:MAG: hypothetical protein FJ207_02735 [Gemmatimonadetes bacterium]|nr:hypothetical protein [Gemmatimonadota bacterium]